MNKTDRLLAIVLELQRNGMQRAEDLASTLEMSVRTIYRDIQALSEAGVPVIGAPGQGYSLAEGYFLPPVSFTAEEVVTLLLGIDFVEQQFDAGYGAKAGASRRKIEAVLPEPVRKEAEQVRMHMRLLTPGWPAGNETPEDTLALLRRAILEERHIRFHYVKKNAGSGRQPAQYARVGPIWPCIRQRYMGACGVLPFASGTAPFSHKPYEPA